MHRLLRLAGAPAGLREQEPGAGERAGARVRRGVRAVALVRGRRAVRRRGAFLLGFSRFRRFSSRRGVSVVRVRRRNFFAVSFGCGHFLLASNEGATRGLGGFTRERRVKFFETAPRNAFFAHALFYPGLSATFAPSQRARAQRGTARTHARTRSLTRSRPSPPFCRLFECASPARAPRRRATRPIARRAITDRRWRPINARFVRPRRRTRETSGWRTRRRAKTSSRRRPWRRRARCCSASTRRPA